MKRKKTILKGVVFGVVIAVLASFCGAIGWAVAHYEGRILPRVWIGETFVGGLAGEAAQQKVRSELQPRHNEKIKIKINGKVVAEPTFSEIGVSPQVREATDKALSYGHPRRNPVWLVEMLKGVSGVRLNLRSLVYKQTFENYVKNVLNAQVKMPSSANWILTGGKLQMVYAQSGEMIDQYKLAQDLLRILPASVINQIDVVTLSTSPEVGDDETLALKPQAEKLLGSQIVFSLGEKKFTVAQKVFMSWVDVERIAGVPALTFQADKLTEYLQKEIAPQVEIAAKDARFVMENGKVSIFSQAEDGKKLDIEETIKAIRLGLEKGNYQTELVLESLPSQIKTTNEIEKLGIKTLIGTGESNFRGSPRNRILNIKVGSERFNGVLIPPGATFGFNENLGPVNKQTGYAPELVIKEHVTTPEYGGGICQISTTAFRAAIYSGLKIVERHNHAYPVAYYGTPGLDATVYPNQRTWRDGTDLKFINDTPGYILIQTKIEDTKLFFEFWGTSDGREVKLVGPVTYDRKSNGSVRAKLTQQILKNGQLLREDVFLSSYKSPSLFPHIVAGNAEKPVVVPKPTPATPAPSPKPSATPKPVTIKKP
jgi:vancomycin resistance protein YoaR